MSSTCCFDLTETSYANRTRFYYVPEQDTDDMRRDTVTQSLGKTSIRAARKQHKVSRQLSRVLWPRFVLIVAAILLEAPKALSALFVATLLLSNHCRKMLPHRINGKTFFYTSQVA